MRSSPSSVPCDGRVAELAQVALGVAVLGEDDDAAIVPRAAAAPCRGAADRDAGHWFARIQSSSARTLASGASRCCSASCAHVVEELARAARRASAERGCRRRPAAASARRAARRRAVLVVVVAVGSSCRSRRAGVAAAAGRRASAWTSSVRQNASRLDSRRFWRLMNTSLPAALAAGADRARCTRRAARRRARASGSASSEPRRRSSRLDDRRSGNVVDAELRAGRA